MLRTLATAAGVVLVSGALALPAQAKPPTRTNRAKPAAAATRMTHQQRTHRATSFRTPSKSRTKKHVTHRKKHNRKGTTSPNSSAKR